MTSTLLQGIKVVDFTAVVSGPVCTHALAMMGAEVIKVEPPTGDVSRQLGPPSVEDFSAYFVQINRNKKSVVLNLKEEDDRAACKKLIASADVVVENFRPGAMKKLGLDFETLQPQHPKLIYVSISGFGDEGPWKHMRAYDSMIQALGGFMPRQGQGGTPQLVRCALADKIAGHTAFEAVLAALFARERGQGGQKVSISMLDAYIAFMMHDQLRFHTFMDHPQEPRALDLNSTFRTSDGWVSMLFLHIDEYHSFFRAVDREELCMRAEFASFKAIAEHLAVWKEAMQEITAAWTTDALMHIMVERGLPVAPVLDIAQMLDFPQVRHNHIFYEADAGPKVGRVRYARGPWRFSRSRLSEHANAPHLGQHSQEILSAAGLEAQEVDPPAAAAAPAHRCA